MRLFFRFMLCSLLLACGLRGMSQTSHPSDTVVVGDNDDSLPPPSSGEDNTVDTSNITTQTAASDSVIVRHLPDTMISRLLKDPAYAYANDSDYWKIRHNSDGAEEKRLPQVVYQLLFFIILGIAIVVLLYLIIYRIFYQPSRKKRSAELTEDTAEIIPADLESKLQEALKAGDHRLAVRYYYLLLLQHLQDKNLIKLQNKSTNRDYLDQLSGSEYASAFRFLTGAYEKVWYGEFGLGQEQFSRLQQYFLELDKTIRR